MKWIKTGDSTTRFLFESLTPKQSFTLVEFRHGFRNGREFILSYFLFDFWNDFHWTPFSSFLFVIQREMNIFDSLSTSARSSPIGRDYGVEHHFSRRV